MTFRSITFLFLSFVAALCSAQPPLQLIGTTDGGSAYEVCYHNEHLYVGCANTLEVFTLNGPDHTPDNMVFKQRLLSQIDQIMVHNGFLYVCANHDGLYKFNITDPTQPSEVAHYKPDDLSASVYDIAFFGDTIVTAAKAHLDLLIDNGSSITYHSTYATYPDPGRVRGVDIKNDQLAYTVAFTPNSVDDGVYLVDLNTMTQLDHYAGMNGDPVEVYFGQNTNLLHVMGGILPQTFFHGEYFALNIGTPGAMSLAFQDTIFGFALLGSVSSPMSAVVMNDTVYVSTQGGGPINVGLSYSGQVYVYDGTDANNVTRLTDLYAGLYHFDADIHPQHRVMYVASEWYGVLSVDVNDIYNEVDLGLTLTGGWCHGSAFADDHLVEANEGYGIQLYDVSVPSDPLLLAEDTAVGFCRAISMDGSGDHVFGWYITGDGFRVFDGNDLSPITSIPVQPAAKGDFRRSRYHPVGFVATILEVPLSADRIVVANVMSPTSPSIAHNRLKANVEDLLFHSGGALLVCAKDSLMVFDPITMNLLGSATPPLGILQPYTGFTLQQDTLYVHYRGVGEGIARYKFNPGTFQLDLIDAVPYTLVGQDRVHMASNDSLLFIATSLDSLKALSRTPPFSQVDIYDHGADFIFDGLWGVQDLYFQDGKLFLNEYMGMTSMFDPDFSTSVQDREQSGLDLFYSAATNALHVNFSDPGVRSVQVFNVEGKLVRNEQSNMANAVVDMSGLSSSIYLVSVNEDGKHDWGRFVKH